MKTMFLAAAAVLSLGIGAAYAGDGDGYSAPTVFSLIPGEQPPIGGPVNQPSAQAQAVQEGLFGRQGHAVALGRNTSTGYFAPARGATN